MAQPTYLLVPNFTFKPSGPIRLGNIIADPRCPHRILTSVDAEALDNPHRYPRVERVAEFSRTVARGKGYDVSMAVWVRFLQVVSGGMSGERATRVSAEYTMESLVTEYFVQDPDPAEIAARVAQPRVRDIMSGTRFSRAQPVYMINGLKIAKGLAARREVAQRVSGSVDGEATLTPAGEVCVGAQVGGGVDSDERDEWTAGEDIVFAYQLLKIEFKGWGTKKRMDVDEFVPKSAILGQDDDDSEVDHDGQYGYTDVEILTSAAAVADIDANDVGRDVVVVGEGDLTAFVISSTGTG
jgi:hypothetical protein